MSATEALRAADGWLTVLGLPGSAAARAAIASVTPLVMTEEITPRDLDDLASIVEERGRSLRDPQVPLDVHLAQLNEAVRAAFERVERERA
ncbi:MAG TPA: hypothetical protein VMD91_13625 [Candidatus Sulfotelmatobacter sp.]|nr:hypothetical protein [Candidatus Sulfotelmatobacter sp.]